MTIDINYGQKLLSLLGLGDIAKEEQVAVIARINLLSRDIFLKIAVENLKDNKDLQTWLVLSDSPDLNNLAPYNFLKEKIPDFEMSFLKELQKNFKEIKST